MSWLSDRLAEPSTHAGLGAFAMCLAQFFPTYAPVIAAVGSVFGALAAVNADPNSPKPPSGSGG